MSKLYSPLTALKEGHWFKLICGASYQHLPAVRNLALAYALAGADCIDVASDPAVVAAVKAALDVAENLATTQAYSPAAAEFVRPWLMVSLNDGEDPHFRKAAFEFSDCPPGCHRPCESVCPAEAITFPKQNSSSFAGVISELCYGCGRCLPVCPSQHITTQTYVSTPAAITASVLMGVDAIEIHTQVGREADFERLWRVIRPHRSQLKVLAVSCPDAPGLGRYLQHLWEMMQPLDRPLVWQADGRPMSGDIGKGTTHAAIRLGQKLLATDLPGYVQLAGGTNQHTVDKLRSLDLLPHPQRLTKLPTVAGVAYGSYARSLLAPIINQLEPPLPSAVSAQTYQKQQQQLEDSPRLLKQAIDLATGLVGQLKQAAPVILSIATAWILPSSFFWIALTFSTYFIT
ncbi:circadian clock protein LdpA [Sphaerothrix gracilis]|uniref:circadian clock protein LdpA n=1 Tax=Sphaerothrix gracilis TaxID=3151835 RepID=UPI0031FC40B6